MKFNLPLWFLPCLFVTKLLYYAICKMCRNKQPLILASLSLLAALGFTYTLMSGPSLPFNFNVALKMLFFFGFGRYFFLCLPAMDNFTASKPKTALTGLTMLAITVVVAWFAPGINYSGDTFPNIAAFFITASLGSLCLCFLSMSIDNCKALEYIGKRTLAVLAMHKFPILLFQTVGPFQSPLDQYDSLPGIASGIVVIIISIALCLVAEKIIQRFFPFLLGDFSRFSHLTHQSFSASSK